MRVRATAPGRVNLIGDHTDYTGGFVLPLAIDLATTVELEVGGDQVVLVSDALAGVARVPLDVADPRTLEPAWARFVGGVVGVVRPAVGGTGTVHTTLPLGSGLSSSAAFEVALALALGQTGSPLDLALVAQRAEHDAVGVPCGIMDQLTSAAGVEGHALLVDCTTLAVTPVPMPAGAAVWIVPSGQRRELAGSAYAERRAQCEAAAAIVGPLRDASLDAVERIPDTLVRARARHVVTENARVLACADSLRRGDLADAGRLMIESHRSLRGDFAVSTPALDATVDALCALDGVHGARLTGAGFGGSVVALAADGVVVPGGRQVRPSAGARVERVD